MGCANKTKGVQRGPRPQSASRAKRHSPLLRDQCGLEIHMGCKNQTKDANRPKATICNAGKALWYSPPRSVLTTLHYGLCRQDKKCAKRPKGTICNTDKVHLDIFSEMSTDHRYTMDCADTAKQSFVGCWQQNLWTRL